MRYELSNQTAASVHRPRLKVGLDYAAHVRAEEQRRQRREAAWAVLSLIALVLCWDLSARMDQALLGEGSGATLTAAEVTETIRKPGSPRRLRKLSDEAEGDGSGNFAWTGSPLAERNSTRTR